jgi:hypothetical protein
MDTRIDQESEMVKGTEKRHPPIGTALENAQLELDEGGVGGRQGQGTPPPWGGGYQDNCIPLNFGAPKKNRDPRVDEFYAMGLPQMWLDVVDAIGVDAFLAVWRILDAHPNNYEDNGMKLVPIRRYSSYLKYQRNRYIEALVAQGLTTHDIKRRLESQLCETVSIRHITRLVNKR